MPSGTTRARPPCLFVVVPSHVNPKKDAAPLFRPGSRIPRDRWRAAVMAYPKPLLYVVTPQFAGQAFSLQKNRPATQIEVFETAGHALFADEPDRFNALLSDFLLKNGLSN